jgi:GPH family glycoside/pentoside/hexuronide:cation symporter
MNIEQHHITAPQDRVRVSQKLGFGIGAMVAVIAVNAVAGLSQLYLNVGLKLSPILVGVVMMLPRLWDAFTDPAVGHLSDNTRSRWGRRIPYIFVGAIITGGTYMLLFSVPRGWGDISMLVYFTVMSLLFFTGITIYSIPQGALGLEMTADYHERTRIFSFSAFFAGVGGLALPWFYWLANRPIFSDEVEGLRWVGVGVGLVLMVCGLTCALVCKEGKRDQAMHQNKTKFWQSFGATLQNRSFVWLISIIILVAVGFNLVGGFGSYVTIYYLYGGDTVAASTLMGVFGTVWAVTTLAGIYPMNWISSHIGKRKTVMLFLFIMGVGNFSKVVCYSPEHPYLVLIPAVMLAGGMLVLFTLGASMMADVCDEEEVRTGIRREGIYQASYGWWMKLGTALGPLVCGIILEATGFNAELDVQPERTLYLIRAWDILLPSSICFLAIYLLYKSPLTEKRAYEVKQILAKRRVEDTRKEV